MSKEVRICKRFTFDAAHRLPMHDGKCAREHGHTYILEVEVAGRIQEQDGSSNGMVLDFAILKQVVNDEILLIVDHWNLNKRVLEAKWTEYNPEQFNMTTAENLVVMFRDVLARKIAKYFSGVRLTRLRLHETPDSWAEWRVEDDRVPEPEDLLRLR
jgi:6-pyruvoyltetrahydropterin/6-carboxytetrahydropterin synthase